MDVQTIDTTQRRLKILTADDLDALYGRPTFTPEERRYYFALSPPEQEALQEFRTIKARVWFFCAAGLLKANHLFFPGGGAGSPRELTYTPISAGAKFCNNLG